MTKPIPKPGATELVLFELADRYQPGDSVSLSKIAEIGSISEGVAGAIRKWARSVGRWPYSDRVSGSARWMQRRDRRGGS
jgi:hypothetical protein